MDRDVAPNEWECQVIIAVTESGGAEAAAERLGATRPGFTRQSVQKIMTKVEKWARGALWTRGADRRLHVTARGRQIVDVAHRVVGQYQLMRQASARPAMPTLACLPHHAYFVSLAEDLIWRAPPPETDKLQVEYLPQGDRSDSDSYQDAATHLLVGTYQLVIGPRPANHSNLESTLLYRSQLEAMVGVRYPHRTMSLQELITRHRLLLPPRNTRSRQLLEDAIIRGRLDDPHSATRIAAETNEIATSVMRIRNENSRRGAGDSRLVVAPSDVALAFKQGMEFGGRHAERFRWVPIIHRDEQGNDQKLPLEVCVTTLSDRSSALTQIVDALGEAIRQIGSPGGVGLEGEDVRRPAVPTQQIRANG